MLNNVLHLLYSLFNIPTLWIENQVTGVVIIYISLKEKRLINSTSWMIVLLEYNNLYILSRVIIVINSWSYAINLFDYTVILPNMLA